MADYVLLFRSPGENAEPIRQGTHSGITNEEWIKLAHPIWYDINESDVLSGRSARENEDEKHICSLQLETIRRCVRLWSNPRDMVLDPFGGIGSTGVVALEQGRLTTMIELKESYFAQMVKNMASAGRQEDLFSMFETESKLEMEFASCLTLSTKSA